MHHGMLGPGARKQHLASCFDASCLLLSFLNVALGVVVHPEAEECECYTNALDGMYGLIEPDDCDTDDSHPFEQRCNGVRNR